jgi:hypothetical protein
MLIQLQPPSEAFQNFLYPFNRSGRGCPLLRASSEHVFIARSASKKGTWPLLPFP